MSQLTRTYRENQESPPPDDVMWKGTIDQFLNECTGDAGPLHVTRHPLNQQLWHDAWLGPMSFPPLADTRVGNRTVRITASPPGGPFGAAGVRTTGIVVRPPGRTELLRCQVAAPVQGRFWVIRGGTEQQAGPMGQRLVLAGGRLEQTSPRQCWRRN